MPSSHGGGFSGGGGGFHSSGSSGGGRGGNNGPRYSRNIYFPGAVRYYYFVGGVRRSFYYSGVPRRKNISTMIISTTVIVLLVSLILSLVMRMMIPHKLKDKYCEFYPSYVSDADNLFTQEEEAAIAKSMESFYDKTGIQPYLFAFNWDNFPSKYGSLNETSIEKYAYDVYVNTFDDEGHFMICLGEKIDSSGNVVDWIWIDCSGDRTDNVIDNGFDDFQSDMNKYMAKSSYTSAEAITMAFDNSTQSIMKPNNLLAVFILIIFLAIFIIVPIVGCVKGVKEAKEINAYCDYREANGGQDFIFDGKSDNANPSSSDPNDSDLFD